MALRGEVILDGPCNVQVIGTGAGFSVTAPGGEFTTATVIDEGYKVTASVTAHKETVALGLVTRDDMCWGNDLGKVCAWK